MKKCFICGEYKEESEFYKDITRGDGLSSRCMECCSNRKRNRPYNGEKQREYQKEYNIKPENKIKILAHTLVRKAIKTGELIKENCEICGKIADAHHDNYSKPLDVRWLCRKHHKKYHAKLKVLTN